MSMGCPPAPVYKGARGEAAGQEEGAPWGESYSHGRTPPFLVGVGEGKEGREEEKEKAPLLVQFILEGEGARGCPGRPSSSPIKAH